MDSVPRRSSTGVPFSPDSGGPRRPSADVQNDIVLLLGQDTSRVGSVYRLRHSGLSARQIGEELNISSSSSVLASDKIIRAMFEGVVPSAPSVARRLAQLLWSIRESGIQGLQLETMRYANRLLRYAELRADNLVEQQIELGRADEARGLTGSIVNYIRCPADDASLQEVDDFATSTTPSRAWPPRESWMPSSAQC